MKQATAISPCHPVSVCQSLVRSLSALLLTIIVSMAISVGSSVRAETNTLVKDMFPGTGEIGSHARGFTKMGGFVYFFRLTGSYDFLDVAAALYKTDGTAGNTTKVL
ncbi:MAG: hypothetical protein ACOYMN_12775, partial [Roseimicrobium sp.]